ncbi:MAG: VOC family protein [Acidimicrobiales bacterium]|jgi:catechol 2,3-dioxygenase-like lactoylglutathione lyase family enzyme|nr:VOC family protein [Acidimicrobiales bacterium]
MHHLRVVFRTNRYDESVAFYSDVLGLDMTDSWGGSGCRGCLFAWAGTLVEFYEGDWVESGTQLAIEVPDAHAQHAQLVAAGGEPNEPADMPWGHRSVFISDPHGNELNFFEIISEPSDP